MAAALLDAHPPCRSILNGVIDDADIGGALHVEESIVVRQLYLGVSLIDDEAQERHLAAKVVRHLDHRLLPCPTEVTEAREAPIFQPDQGFANPGCLRALLEAWLVKTMLDLEVVGGGGTQWRKEKKVNGKYSVPPEVTQTHTERYLCSELNKSEKRS